MGESIFYFFFFFLRDCVNERRYLSALRRCKSSVNKLCLNKKKEYPSSSFIQETQSTQRRNNIIHSHTPEQTPHFDTRSEIYPSRTLVKNAIMKTFKSAQNIGSRARKCIWHCFSCEMGYLSTRLRSFTKGS